MKRRKGTYRVGIEGFDYFPYPTFRLPGPQLYGGVSITTRAGAYYGQQVFSEEYWSGSLESAAELNLASALRDRRQPAPRGPQ